MRMTPINNIVGIFMIVSLIIELTIEQIVYPNCATMTYFTDSGGTTSSSCLQCMDGFYASGGSMVVDSGVTFVIKYCSPCSSSCLTCNPVAPLNCLTCRQDYVFIPTLSICMSCNYSYQNCGKCTTMQCTECLPNFIPTSPNGCDIDCPGLHGLGCLKCNETTCHECDYGYVMNLTLPLSCTPCSTLVNCDICGSGPRCASCLTGFFLNITNNNLSCFTCSQLAYCTDCKDGPVCTDCNPGCYLDFSTNSSSCVPCSSFLNCLNCTDGPACTACSSTFYLDFSSSNQSCVPCSSILNCLNCLDGPKCTLCLFNHILTSSLPWNQCRPCAPAEYSSSNTTCSPCPEFCLNCFLSVQPRLICTSCSAGFVTDSANSSCVKCDNLMPKCLQCSSPTVCNLCQYPFLIDETSNCSKCEPGYQYVNGYCAKPIGCQNALPDYSKCLACSWQTNFIYQSSTNLCKCAVGYYQSKLQGFTECISRCGDGILIFEDEECDDGNVRNQDGCSALCKKETGFTCIPESPTKCILEFTPEKFSYNYAYRYEGLNKCKFSLSLTPPNPNLKYIDWAKYLTHNVSEDFILPNSKSFRYLEETNELTIELEYLKDLEDLTIQFKLSPGNQAVKISKFTQMSKNFVSESHVLSEPYQNQLISQSVGLASSTFPNLQLPYEITLIIQLSGINAKLTYQEDTILKVQESARITSFIITILILLQFIVGSFYHKMIGLETIQILQFFYFVRLIFEQRHSTFLNSMNVFKYTAYGGYTDSEAFYGAEIKDVESLTYMTVNENFVMVGLMKYFSLNVNLSLLVPLLVLIGFLFTLGRKYFKRNQYMKHRDQSIKDEYTVLRRSSQWFYDHFVFPYLNIFNMIIIFSTILYLQSQPTSASAEIENSPTTKMIEITSFSPHLAIAFLTFVIYCFEVFQSYEEFLHSRLTDEQKARVPKSTYEKLEHDENNPDRPNYKPGYVLFYLVFYIIVQIVLMLNVLVEPLKDFGVEIMSFVSFLYLVFVWKWKPYNKAVEFHNKVLRFNHFTVFLFMVTSAIFKRVEMKATYFLVFLYIILLMLVIITFCGYVRIVIEYKFRKKFLDDPNLMEQTNPKNKGKLSIFIDSKKQILFKNNPFMFENQIKYLFQEEKNVIERKLTEQQINEAKMKLRKQIFEDKKRLSSTKKDLNIPNFSLIIKDLKISHAILPSRMTDRISGKEELNKR